MNIKKVDDKPMVIHTKEKPKLKVKRAPETKIKGRNVLTVQHGPKIAGSASGKNVAADGKIKLKRSSVHVTDKKKTVQTKTAADAWNTGAEMAAELYRKEKETEQHKAEAAAQPYRTEKEMKPHRAEAAAQPYRADMAAEQHKAEPYRANMAVEQHKTEAAAQPHRTDMRTETHMADRGKNRKCGSP